MNQTLVACANCGAKNRIPANKQHLRPKCGRCQAMLDLRTAAVPVELDDISLKDMLAEHSVPMLVEFHSPGCGACVTLAPVIRRLAKQFAGRLIVGRIDISRSPLAAAHFQIRGVPMLIFFRHGTIVDELAGAPSEAMLVERIESLLRSPG